MKPHRRPSHLKRADDAEARALRHLISRGLRHLESNYRCRYGEIDIVMADGEQIVFVEVRYRSDLRYGGAAASVDKHKQRKLRNTAEHYRQNVAGAERKPCRFDVVCISGDIDGDELDIDWIDNAF